MGRDIININAAFVLLNRITGRTMSTPQGKLATGDDSSTTAGEQNIKSHLKIVNGISYRWYRFFGFLHH